MYRRKKDAKNTSLQSIWAPINARLEIFFLLLFFTPPDRVASTGFGCHTADGDASKTVTDPTVCVYTIDASVMTSSGVGRALIIIIRFFVYYFLEFLYIFIFENVITRRRVFTP